MGESGEQNTDQAKKKTIDDYDRDLFTGMKIPDLHQTMRKLPGYTIPPVPRTPKPTPPVSLIKPPTGK